MQPTGVEHVSSGGIAVSTTVSISTEKSTEKAGFVGSNQYARLCNRYHADIAAI
jgi:hypothetical protein